jgi:hypothetical protein
MLQTVAEAGRPAEELPSEFNDLCCDWTRSCIQKVGGGGRGEVAIHPVDVRPIGNYCTCIPVSVSEKVFTN